MLEVESVTKAYGSRVAVKELSLAVEAGEVFGLLGPNGAGKSTTVGMIVGLFPPDSGTVRLDGRDVSRDPQTRARVGIAPQSLAIYPNLTARENLEFFGGLHGLSRSKRSERASWALEFVDLSGREGDRAKTFSGGMLRRLNLAAALVHDPDVLLFDEPTVGVDPQSRNHMFDNIEALKAQGKAIVYTTHYMEEAERLCDRVGIIDHGVMMAVGSVAGLVAEHGGEARLVGSWISRDGACVLDETVRDDAHAITRLHELAAAGTVDRFSIERPTLEAVFLNLTGRALRDGPAAPAQETGT